MVTLLWLRRDLRLHDQPALAAALADGPVVPVYILDDETPRHRRMGGASRWWLHHSLAALGADLRARGSRLILRRGRSEAVLADLAAETGATRVHAVRHYEPWWRNAERAAGQQLELICHAGNYLAPPGSVRSGGGTPYRIFTPFWRALQQRMPPAAPLAAPVRITAPDVWPSSDTLSDWELLPDAPDWAAGFAQMWTPGEAGAEAALARFAGNAAAYPEARNLPAIAGSSRLSPHLHFGEITPSQIWHRH